MRFVFPKRGLLIGFLLHCSTYFVNIIANSSFWLALACITSFMRAMLIGNCMDFSSSPRFTLPSISYFLNVFICQSLVYIIYSIIFSIPLLSEESAPSSLQKNNITPLITILFFSIQFWRRLVDQFFIYFFIYIYTHISVPSCILPNLFEFFIQFSNWNVLIIRRASVWWFERLRISLFHFQLHKFWSVHPYQESEDSNMNKIFELSHFMELRLILKNTREHSIPTYSVSVWFFNDTIYWNFFSSIDL